LRFCKHILFFQIFILLNKFFFAQPVEIPTIDFITVNQTSSLPVIHWSVNNPSVLNGYAVKRFIRSYPTVPNDTWHTVQRIENSNVFSYEDNSVSYGEATPNIQSEIYEITAYKINGTDTVFSLPSDKHKTIYVSGNYDYCSNKVTIIWNNYIGWENSFLKYRIYRKENSGSFIKIAETFYNDTVFVNTNPNYNSDYTYYVKAVRNDGTESLSNLKLITTQAINFPSFLKIDSAVIYNNSEFNISFSGDETADVDQYFLFKSYFSDADYMQIDDLQNINNTKLKFSDKNIDINKNAYYYIAAVDYCGNIVFRSDTVSNIALFATAYSGNRINSLKWNDIYSNSRYQIFRSQNNSQFNQITNTGNHSYEDNIQSLYENQFLSETISGKFCYYVQIKENDFLNKSNITCAEQDETVIFPNAFNPKSTIDENRTFKPKAAFISDYQLTIYGSLGEALFESMNPDIGWNGMLKNGKLAPISSYLYIVKYKNSKGKYVKLKKYVTLVY